MWDGKQQARNAEADIMIDLNTEITYLKGVGPEKSNLLKSELGIATFADLLQYYPYRYIDRSQILKVSDITNNTGYVVLKGKVRDMQTVGTGRAMRLTVRFYDGTGAIELVWFQGLRWVRNMLKNDVDYLVMGKPSFYGTIIQIAHPDMEVVNYTGEQKSLKFEPVYSITEKLKSKGLSSKGIAKLMSTLMETLGNEIPETLPQDIITRYHLPGRLETYRKIHFPQNPQEVVEASRRLKFEELFFLQLDYQYTRVARQRLARGVVFNVVGEHFNRFYKEKLPFPLTKAQQRVIKEIRADMKSGHQMNRLLQGDVGSGKTLVALLCMLIALDNGCQACLMAPTEILAIQHYATFCKMLDGQGISVELLTGAVKTAQKKQLKQRLQNGETDLLIGTHALIEDDVVFKNLGFVVIDEQHRFGVEQRAKMWSKAAVPPHILVMTATPIPRTLAMTLYGDLDCSVIDELPPGRQPVQTLHATDAQRLKVWAFLRQQIAQGRQVYIVYPLINESESLDLKDLMDGYESVTRDFPRPQYQVSVVHGQMNAEAKAMEMDRFKRGETHIMVSTTVIEVGVDVPNATVMVIENAERFGLSQLHQLRGRVGRGGGQSYCILMTKPDLAGTSKERIATMCATTDGFKIAEADLKLRGPGDIQGLQQSGILQLKMADIVNDEAIVKASRDEVGKLLEADPQLELPQHRMLQRYIQQKKNKQTWEKIS